MTPAVLCFLPTPPTSTSLPCCCQVRMTKGKMLTLVILLELNIVLDDPGARNKPFMFMWVECSADNLYLNLVHTSPFIKTFFVNFQKCKVDLFYILIDKQILETVFCSNIAPSLSSGNHLFYKAEYMGQSCPNQVWTITFDWSALATWNKHFWTAFWRLFSGIPHLPGLGDVPGARCRHLAPGFSGARCSVSGDMKGGQVGYPWKGLSKCSLEMLISGR